MRALTLGLTLIGTPALAHHEVVMVTSMMPVLGGLATIVSAGLAAFWAKRTGK